MNIRKIKTIKELTEIRAGKQKYNVIINFLIDLKSLIIFIMRKILNSFIHIINSYKIEISIYLYFVSISIIISKNPKKATKKSKIFHLF